MACTTGLDASTLPCSVFSPLRQGRGLGFPKWRVSFLVRMNTLCFLLLLQLFFALLADHADGTAAVVCRDGTTRVRRVDLLLNLDVGFATPHEIDFVEACAQVRQMRQQVEVWPVLLWFVRCVGPEVQHHVNKKENS